MKTENQQDTQCLLPNDNKIIFKLAEEYLDEEAKKRNEYGSYAIVNQYTLTDFVKWLRPKLSQK